MTAPEELLRREFERDYDKYSMVDVDFTFNERTGYYVNQNVHIAFGGYQAALQTAKAVGDEEVVELMIEPIGARLGKQGQIGIFSPQMREVAYDAIQAIKAAGYRITKGDV